MENELVIKNVNFNNDILMAVQDNSNSKIYVGVSWICNGIGLSEKQKDRQVANIQSDIVLKNGSKKLPLKFEGQVRSTLTIELDYLPLWLAKISITPKMQEESPDVVNKLVSYQLKAKDVLAKEFTKKEPVDLSNFQIPKTLSEALLLSANLAKENEIMKPKAEQFDLYIDTKGTFSWNQTAKKIKTRRNKMLEFLRCKKVLNLDNTPSSYYADKDYFTVKIFTYVLSNGDSVQNVTTMVTPKGQDFIYKYLTKYREEYLKFDRYFKVNRNEVA